MARTTKTSTTESLYREPKAMLEERRRELELEVHAKIRDARAETTDRHDVLDEGDASENDIQGEIRFALIQMSSEALDRINAALRRIDEGTYGVCVECGNDIAEARLRALPFAVRCKDCEEGREVAERRPRMAARLQSPIPLL